MGAFGGCFNIPKLKIFSFWTPEDMQVVFLTFSLTRAPNHNLKPGRDSMRSSSLLGSRPIWVWAVRIKTALHILAITLSSHSETITFYANIPLPIQQCLRSSALRTLDHRHRTRCFVCLLHISPKERWRRKSVPARQWPWSDSYR